MTIELEKKSKYYGIVYLLTFQVYKKQNIPKRQRMSNMILVYERNVHKLLFKT